MWLRVFLSIVLWLVFRPSVLGINIELIQSILKCQHVVVECLEQKGYSFSIQLRGSGVRDCLQDQVSFCKAEGQGYYCRIMDDRVVTILDDQYCGNAL